MEKPRSLAGPAAREVALVVGVCLLMIVVLPLVLSEFRLALLAKFLTFAIVALAIDLAWGYTGMLSLGHGVFFGLGAYALAMHMKLEAAKDGLPDFMGWSGLRELPGFWMPFESGAFSLLMALVLPALLASVLGLVMFRARVQGVYFSIMTQALALIATLLFVGQQPYTGGTNGMTNFSTAVRLPADRDFRPGCAVRHHGGAARADLPGAALPDPLAGRRRPGGGPRSGGSAAVLRVRPGDGQGRRVRALGDDHRARRRAVRAAGRDHLAGQHGHRPVASRW